MKKYFALSMLLLTLLLTGCSNKGNEINASDERTFNLKTEETHACDGEVILYYKGNIKIYTYCLDSIKVVEYNKEYELKNYFKEIDESASEFTDLIISKLEKEASYRDGTMIVYKDTLKEKISDGRLCVIKCNTNKNKDIYFGPERLGYEDKFCK